MAMALPELQGLLLDMLSTDRPVDAAVVAAMQVLDWAGLMAMARQHRLLPILHWRLTNQRTDLPVPEDVRDKLAAGFKRSSLRVLQMQRELLLIQRILDHAGIPCIALKGAYLAFHAYPHPALRPMRDLDILVPQDRALAAYDRLLAAGYIRPEGEGSDAAATMRTRNHLPPLRSAAAGINIELHTRFFDPDEGPDTPDLSNDPQLWHRALNHGIAGETLRYVSQTDLLLHLIQHSVYHHRFDNGPLVLSDVAYLLDGHTIDWPAFWQRAEQFGLDRGSILLLRMVERYFGMPALAWQDARPLDPASMRGLVQASALLTLRDFAYRYDVDLENNVSGRAGLGRKLRFFISELFPSRYEMATLYPVAADSAAIYRWYLIRWWRLLTVRLPVYLASRRDRRAMDEARHVLRLEQWLEEAAEEPGSAEH